MDTHYPSSKGRLKVFLGYAPGVGKTYSMLEAAHGNVKNGLDVVVGIIESHGRSETDALAKNLEILPRLSYNYKNIALTEMDLDGILKRKPDLVLVDEMAHTNAPGSRHEKRYQDIEELLAAGIDVYTTLNIQHIESFNDAIFELTQIRVQETVPDTTLEDANIELVDLSPTDLEERLREGKVYLPSQATRAMENFFTRSKLLGLRELSLRYTAEQVDEELEEYNTLFPSSASPGNDVWIGTEHVCVCIPDSPLALYLVRLTKRISERQNREWSVLHIRTTPHEPLGESIRRAIKLAENLGGHVELRESPYVLKSILDYIEETNVQELVVGQGRVKALGIWKRFHETLPQALMDHLEGKVLRVVCPPTQGESTTQKALLQDRRWILLVLSILSGTVGALFPQTLPVVLGVFGIVLGYAILMIQNYKGEVKSLRRKNTTLGVLHQFQKQILGVKDGAQLKTISEGFLTQFYTHPSILIMGENTGLLESHMGALTPEEQAVAKWVFASKEPAGQEEETFQGSSWVFFPLISSEQIHGVLGVQNLMKSVEHHQEVRDVLLGISEDLAKSLSKS